MRLDIVAADQSRSLRPEYPRCVEALRGIASGALIAAVPHGCTHGIRPASSSAMILSVIALDRGRPRIPILDTLETDDIPYFIISRGPAAVDDWRGAIKLRKELERLTREMQSDPGES
jgi:hypothetical protein